MKHTQTWTDIYGSACASFEGQVGGYRWLVASPPELAASVPAALEALGGKGKVELLIHDNISALLSFLAQSQPRGVVVVARAALGSGPASELATRTLSTDDGASFQEGGTFPAWQGYSLPTLSNATVGESLAASAAASLGYSVVVTAPDTVLAVLEDWLGAGGVR